MSDGKWYQNPIIGEGKDWFICWDDDDPIELVIATEESKEAEARRLMVTLMLGGEFDCKMWTKGLYDSGLRCFGEDNTFQRAYSCWCYLSGAPVEFLLSFDAKFDELPHAEMVVFSNSDDLPGMWE